MAAFCLNIAAAMCNDSTLTDSKPLDDLPTPAFAQEDVKAEATVLSDAADDCPIKSKSHNVMDLFPVDDFADSTNVAVLEPATHCAKCDKRLLSEVEAMLPELEDMEAFDCHCCRLRLPVYCFTKAQLETAEPDCRGCRGVETVFDKLVDRARKLIEEKEAKRRCDLCAFLLMRLGPTQAMETDKLECSCCERELPERFFSFNQRNKQELRRCGGCLGHEPGGKRSDTHYRAWRTKFRVQLRERWLAEEETNRPRTEPRKGETRVAKVKLLRSRVRRHQADVSELERKGSAGGSALTSDVAKDQKALERMGKRLEKQNPRVFR